MLSPPLLVQAVEEVPVRNMAGRLGIERGALQALQKEASVFCGMVVCFCRHLQWHELANVLYSFQVKSGMKWVTGVKGGLWRGYSMIDTLRLRWTAQFMQACQYTTCVWRH